MWLGFKSKQINNKELHSVAVILNITGAKIEGGHGRGFLVENYLNSDLNAEEYIKKLEKDEKTYNGFSLVTVELRFVCSIDVPDRVVQKCICF